MIILNFAYPLTQSQLDQITAQTGQPVERIINAPAQFDLFRPFTPQTDRLVEAVGLSSDEWRTASILINPPVLNIIALVVLVQLQRHMGRFPRVLRLRRPAPAAPFEVAEIINL